MKASMMIGLVLFVCCYVIPVGLVLIGVSPFYILAALAVIGLLSMLAGPVTRAVQRHKTYSHLKQELLKDIREFEKGKR